MRGHFADATIVIAKLAREPQSYHLRRTYHSDPEVCTASDLRHYLEYDLRRSAVLPRNIPWVRFDAPDCPISFSRGQCEGQVSEDGPISGSRGKGWADKIK